MSDTFVSPQVIQWELTTAELTESGGTYTWLFPHAIPFNYELIGLYVDVATGPTLKDLEFDVLYAAAGTTYASITTSIFGTTLPTIVHTATTGTHFNTPLSPPLVAGPVSALLEGPITELGISNPSYSQPPYGTGFQPYALNSTAYPNAYGNLETPIAETAGSPWSQPSGSSAAPVEFWGNAGDLFLIKVAQCDYSSGAGGATNGVASLWFNKR